MKQNKIYSPGKIRFKEFKPLLSRALPIPRHDALLHDRAAGLCMDLSQHIEEFAAAFYRKTNCDPRKVVMIHQFDSVTGKNIYWFEKKRGRSRKEVLSNLKKQTLTILR
jgi:hypothetical protein